MSEKAPSQEAEPEVTQAVEAIRAFSAAFPGELSQEQWFQVFEQLNQGPMGRERIVLESAAGLILDMADEYREKIGKPRIQR